MRKYTISALIPVYNSSSTILICLDSLRKQNIKIDEIILVDNASSDDSVKVIQEYKKKHKDIRIKILEKKQTTSVASSYNMGLKTAKGEYIVTMHSDSSLPTTKELGKLLNSMLADKTVIATYSKVLHPVKIWNTYNFWEKCQSCRVVDQEIPAMNGKFDCFRKDMLIKINGFDDVNFDKYGDGLDADIYYRLNRVGKVVPVNARVVHLHYLRGDYTLSMWIEKRKNMSITAGRLLKMYLFKTDIKGILSFSTRPVLAVLPFIPQFQFIGIGLIILFSFFYTKRMFTTKSTLSDPRIVLLPFINIFLIYFEAFWISYTFFTHDVKLKTKL